jgi:hypothetical protein
VKGPKHRFRHRTYAEDLHYEVWETADAAPRATARGRAETSARSTAPSGARWADPRRLGGLPLRGPTLKALKKLLK